MLEYIQQRAPELIAFGEAEVLGLFFRMWFLGVPRCQGQCKNSLWLLSPQEVPSYPSVGGICPLLNWSHLSFISKRQICKVNILHNKEVQI